MDKILWYPSEDMSGHRTSDTLFIPNNTFEKVASEYDDGLQKFISNMQPDTSKNLYMLLHALGAGERWGPNVNGDYFPEEALKHEGEDYGHKTFERYAKLYKHHVNKDPEKSYGDVLHSHWDDQMKRVLLVVSISREKAPDICEKIEMQGQYPDVSMGCRVPWDECSICHKRAKSPRQYCEHAKLEMGKIYPDGRRVYVINRFPRFFDISQVFIGAEKPAKFLHKIAAAGDQPAQQKFFRAPDFSGLEKAASHYGTVPSAMVAEKIGYSIKDAEMVKQVPAGETGAEPDEQIQDELMDGLSKLRSTEPDIPNGILDSIACHPLRESLSSLSSAGIILRPREFQRIVLVKMGHANLADMVDGAGILFDENDADVPEIPAIMPDRSEISGAILKLANPVMPVRSDLQPYLFARTQRAIHESALGGHARQVHEDVWSKYESKPKSVNIAKPMVMAAALFTAYKSGLLTSLPGVQAAMDSLIGKVGLDNLSPAALIPVGALVAAAISGHSAYSRESQKIQDFRYLDDPNVKMASVAKNVAGFAVVGGTALSPYVYREHVKNKARRGDRVSESDKMIHNNPGKASILGLAGLGAAYKAHKQDSSFLPKAGLYTAAAAAPYLSRELTKRKLARGEQPGAGEMGIAMNPGKSALVGTAAVHGARSLANQFLSKTSSDRFVKLKSFMSKLGSDHAWSHLMRNVVLNPAAVGIEHCNFISKQAANAGTVLALAMLGCKEET